MIVIKDKKSDQEMYLSFFSQKNSFSFAEYYNDKNLELKTLSLDDLNDLNNHLILNLGNIITNKELTPRLTTTNNLNQALLLKDQETALEFIKIRNLTLDHLEIIDLKTTEVLSNIYTVSDNFKLLKKYFIKRFDHDFKFGGEFVFFTEISAANFLFASCLNYIKENEEKMNTAQVFIKNNIDLISSLKDKDLKLFLKNKMLQNLELV